MSRRLDTKGLVRSSTPNRGEALASTRLGKRINEWDDARRGGTTNPRSRYGFGPEMMAMIGELVPVEATAHDCPFGELLTEPLYPTATNAPAPWVTPVVLAPFGIKDGAVQSRPVADRYTALRASTTTNVEPS